MKDLKCIDKKDRGFTLIEVMIVVAIIGILSAIAYSSYSSYVTRSARTDAMEQLNEIMTQQQRFVLRQRTYTVNLVTGLGFSASPAGAQLVRTDNGLYDISAAACPNATLVRCVLLTATPVADTRQANINDGTLTLTSRGQKTHRGRTGWYQTN